MSQKVEFPTNAQPVSDELLKQLSNFKSKELYWLSGYCSGIADAKLSDSKSEVAPATQVSVKLKVLVMFASQSGNAEAVANQLHQKLTSQGVEAAIASCAGFKLKELKQQDIILMVAATHGEGEPPDDAIELHELIQSKRAPKLEGVQHAVLALGDSSYEYFCQTGKEFEQAFARLGSRALLERVDCDVDYKEQANQWINQVAVKLNELAPVSAKLIPAQTSQLAESVNYSKENPFTATVLTNQKITAKGSIKNIHHLELSLENSGISYQPGDSLGVWVKNNVQLVESILQLLNISFEEKISLVNKEQSIGQTLIESLELTLLSKPLVKRVLDFIKQDKLRTHVEQIVLEDFASYSQNHQVIDLLKLAKLNLTAQQLVNLLQPIKPRVYSIASSLSANPEEVHLTVALAQTQNETGVRKGAASQYLLESMREDDELMVYVESNKHFKLPHDDTPIIMIGPGTGVAPFRAFMQEREARNANGKSWLFFGNPNFNSDFLYQTEWLEKLKSRQLTHLSVAFSRDQKEKLYVQHQLFRHAASIWQWIDEQQASLYVCGDMSKMAKDVELAIIEIIKAQGNQSESQAIAYLKQMKQSKRYQRDVY
ncbi:assimilatory sulfite reductase (NADPH) flavoprotein subunit [Aliikangiella sp. IMCC44632]